MNVSRSGPNNRAIFTVCRQDSAWSVEHEGAVVETCKTKEEALAMANKRVRALQDAGTPCQVRVTGEVGYFAG
ncbi:MAG: DUF2188 domain-containing protein [Caulobacteraceae bacterium]